jgi:hypothetical protein
LAKSSCGWITTCIASQFFILYFLKEKKTSAWHIMVLGSVKKKIHTRPVWVLGPRLNFPGYKARYKQVLTNSWVLKPSLDLGFLILKIKHFGFGSS